MLQIEMTLTVIDSVSSFSSTRTTLGLVHRLYRALSMQQVDKGDIVEYDDITILSHDLRLIPSPHHSKVPYSEA